ncbi:hypothetical protein POVWA2_090900 [Plasmodium ovale wallikeri]|uniref:Uncharacterized protein n=1 Tax=Plasmodium ovale wallikeri TaxID=864142 RepID=A0A1A9AJF6_PLAOA|nr:hypothetical protein POVWA1_075490 [Plasmodium ovale wallikeri]SBT59043.1 hypothetical protein POVWA2_090900 [Plasmodium ovale wallikeri]
MVQNKNLFTKSKASSEEYQEGKKMNNIFPFFKKAFVFTLLAQHEDAESKMAKSCQTRDMRMLFDYGDGFSTYGGEEEINYIDEDSHNEQPNEEYLRSELSENVNNKHSYEEDDYSSQYRNNEIFHEDEDYFGYLKKQSKKLKLDKANIKKIMKSPKAILAIITTAIVIKTLQR